MTDNSPRPPQLNGWKEIAAYFDKSPRTVQRWEADLGLPVKRMKGQGGEIVYALKEELDAWREKRSQEAQNPPAEAPGDPEASVPMPEPRGPRMSARLVVLAAVALLASVSAWWFTRPGTVATAEFRGNTVVGIDLAGRDVWSFSLDTPIFVHTGIADRTLSAYVPGDPPMVADVDRDGSPEVLAIVTYATDGDWSSQELVCLSASGRERWRYRPHLSYTFAGQTYDRSWRFLSVLVAQGTRAPAIWVSLAASPWWPSVLVRLDADGRPDVRFVHAGALYSLQQSTGPEGWVLAAGGVNNEYASAALALLTEDNPIAVSPQSEGSTYRCDTCPTGAPWRYFLFPRSDIHVAEAEKPYNPVGDIQHTADGFTVRTVESRVHQAYRFYGFTRDFRPSTVTMSDSTAHAVLERRGLLDHEDADCAWRREGVTLRAWTPATGWVDTPVKPPGASVRPSAPIR